MPCHELRVEVFTLRGWMSMSVMVDGSTIGFLLSVSWSGMMMPIHWGGRPTYFPCSESNPVWTRCSKFRGLEISGLFLFFLNMVKYLSNTSNILVRINDRHTLVHLLAFTLHLQKKKYYKHEIFTSSSMAVLVISLSKNTNQVTRARRLIGDGVHLLFPHNVSLSTKNTGRQNNYQGTQGPNTPLQQSEFSLTDTKTLFFLGSASNFICLHLKSRTVVYLPNSSPFHQQSIDKTCQDCKQF